MILGISALGSLTRIFVPAIFLAQICLAFPAQADLVEPIADSSNDIERDSVDGFVKSVIASAMILYETGAHDGKGLLFGIDVSELDMQQRTILKTRLSKLLLGKPVRLSEVSEIGELKYVRVFAPDDVVAQCIGEGLAPWDRILAPNELDYGILESAAKSKGLGIWNDVTVPRPNVDDAFANSIEISQELRSSFRQVRGYLEFEALLDRWARLDSGSRARYKSGISQRASLGQGEKNQLLSQLGQQDSQLRQQQFNNELKAQSNRNMIASSNQRERYQLDETFDDFDLNWNTDMLNSMNDWHDVEDSLGLHNRYTHATVEMYANKVDRDQARVNSKAGRISARHRAERDNYSGRITQLGAQNKRLGFERNRVQGLGEAVGSNLRWGIARDRREINLLDRLDSAIKNGYSKVSTFSPYEIYSDAKPGDTIRIPATLKFVIVNWESSSSRSGIDLFRGTKLYPFTRLFNNVPFYKKCYVFEPGFEYVLKPRVPCRIELRFMDLLTGVE